VEYNVLALDAVKEAKYSIDYSLEKYGVAIFPPIDVTSTLSLLKQLNIYPQVTMLDPWYNKGVGGVRSDYKSYILSLLENSALVSDHIFLWGFPEIVAIFIESIPQSLKLEAWLTWYFKNSPSVIRGWRSSQMACLHLKQPLAKMYPEHFLNTAQKEKLVQGKLRYMPGPTSVIEAFLEETPADILEQALLVGFVGKKEQTGHPAQKPVAVFERLFRMTTKSNDLILDPMCGSGTSGVASRQLGLKVILADINEDYIQIVEKRLGVKRIELSVGSALS
jgi:DNA methylase